MTSHDFTTAPNDAYIAVGAHPPGRGWFAFDVLMPRARKGEARLFAMTLWNSHAEGRDEVRPIRRDIASGDYWYRVPRTRDGANPLKRKALWNGIDLALKFGLPKVAILKDRVSGQCSLDYVFDIVDVRYEEDGSAFWLKLGTRGGDIGTDVEPMDLDHLGGLPERDPLSGPAAPGADSRKDPLSTDQLEAACELARQVYEGAMPAPDAMAQLHEEQDIKERTAGVLLNNYWCLATGTEIRSPMSAEGLAIFADNVIAIEGTSALPRVINAIGGFISYASGQWKYEAHGIRELLDRLQADVALSAKLDVIETAFAEEDADYRHDGTSSTVRREAWARGPQHAAFRRQLVRRWQDACSVHGVACNGQLVASHIVAWSLDESLRGDPDNGLLLSVPLDSLFDRGLISFDDDGVLVRSRVLEARTAEHFGIVTSLRLDWDRITRRARDRVVTNLRRHRERHSATHGYAV
ncbi:MAG: HNH endonuclease [Gammaproteobacteria bacterium]|nr:HNH endonuclease [Gammaproteobacteria bacterium]MBU1441477.1 HNH endonuclease [Gammaproteobacteria bacterium]MBU2288348.1 HNH endonuclease [Gammaproteobacteria bacterium]MBU2409743.1 HNH endonuclease [Gammaproteobacteria bacterium]